MNNDDQYDDDLEDQIDDDDTNVLDVLKDGESLKVPLRFMDSVQRSIADGWDATAHRPGWRTPPRIRDQDQVVADAHRDYVRFLQDAHRTPVVAAAKPVRRPSTLSDAQAAAERAYEERNQWLRDAHRQGRQP